MNRAYKTLALSCLALALAGCESSTDQVDAGGVLLTISDFDGLPTFVSVSAENADTETEFQTSIGSLTISSVSKNPSGPTGPLMNVEIQSYEVSYSRADRGTRVPNAFVQQVLGSVPINGTSEYTNLPILKSDQFLTVPIRDLLDFGIDTETNSRVIILNVRIRFFGRTLSGDTVETAPRSFTLEVRP